MSDWHRRDTDTHTYRFRTTSPSLPLPFPRRIDPPGGEGDDGVCNAKSNILPPIRHHYHDTETPPPCLFACAFTAPVLRLIRPSCPSSCGAGWPLLFFLFLSLSFSLSFSLYSPPPLIAFCLVPLLSLLLILSPFLFPFFRPSLSYTLSLPLFTLHCPFLSFLFVLTSISLIVSVYLPIHPCHRPLFLLLHYYLVPFRS